MHRKRRCRPAAASAAAALAAAEHLLVLVCLEALLLLTKPHPADANANAAGCNRLTCKAGERCVQRQFACDKSPCPIMFYCVKSKRESLKGPESCESVLCTQGYRCHIQLDDCEWNQKCQSRRAMCLLERELRETLPNCVDVPCPANHHCVLRELPCPSPPCRIVKSCAPTKEVYKWLQQCQQLGCRSELDCFLRKSPDDCLDPSCDYIPECIGNIVSEDKKCVGWVCPRDQECWITTGISDQVTRSCRGPKDFGESMDFSPPRATLADLEREILLEEKRRIANYLQPTMGSNFSTPVRQTMGRVHSDPYSSIPENPGGYTTARVRRVSVLPNMRSASFDDSAWLTYLKRKVGSEAVQYWIEKAKNHENHQGFLKWLNSVESLLDPVTYQRWICEIVDIPEFASWISKLDMQLNCPQSVTQRVYKPYQAQRRLYSDSSAIGARRNFPDSIGATAKTSLDSNKDYPYMGPRMKVDSEQPFAEQAARPYPADFATSNPRRLDETEKFMQRQPDQGPSLLNPLSTLMSNTMPPMSRVHEFEEADQGTRNIGQQYRQPQVNSYQTSIPDQVNAGKSYPSNYAQINYNFHANSTPSFPFPQQLKPFFSSGSNEQNTDDPQKNFQTARRNFQPLASGNATDTKQPEDNKPMEHAVTSMLETIQTAMKNGPGLEQFTHSSPNIVKLVMNQSRPQVVYSSESENTSETPNVLIYFPPPLNFLVYYSLKNQSSSPEKTGLSSNRTALASNKRTMNLTANEKSFGEGTDEFAENDKKTEISSESQDKLGNLDDRKELYFIRKMIKELMEYWLEKEKTSKTKTGESGDEQKVPAASEKLSTTTIYNPSITTPISPQTNVETNNEESRSIISNKTNRIRFLVDLDKNPEIMQALFPKNKTGTKTGSDPREYQVIVNLKDYINAKEEELISRELIDWATSEGNKNLTKNSMPKILYVVPVFHENEDDPVANALKKVNDQTNAESNVTNTVSISSSQNLRPNAKRKFRKTTPKPKKDDYDDNDSENENSREDEDLMTYDEALRMNDKGFRTSQGTQRQSKSAPKRY